MKKIALIIFILSCTSCELWDFLKGDSSPFGDESLVLPEITFRYLAFSDYYSGDCIGLKFDITNKSEKTINRIRLTIDMSYEDYSGGKVYPDIYEYIAAGSTLYSYWVGTTCGFVFYLAHEIKGIHIWYTDGTDFVAGEN